jgi:circadian clock protein KaiC
MSIGAQSAVDISYLSDTIVLLGYYEAKGEVHRFLTVVKRRQGEHETTIRDLTIRSDGIHVGEPLAQFSNLLLGDRSANSVSRVGGGSP